MIEVNNSWQTFLSEQFHQDYYQTLRAFLAREYRTKTVYPAMNDIFNAYRATPPEDIRVVILGQDPYHQPGQAHGMAFSVRPGIAPPPSLQNMFKEIAGDTGAALSGSGYLLPWAEQGVFLLNACLTVEQNRPNAHAGHGWETLTDNTIRHINALDQPLVYLLWGRNARNKRPLIDNSRHLVLEAPHPSPLSAYAGFFGCGHFKKANDFLQANGLSPIDWAI